MDDPSGAGVASSTTNYYSPAGVYSIAIFMPSASTANLLFLSIVLL